VDAPKDFLSNIRFRRAVIRLGSRDRDDARKLWIACRRDVLFFFNAFLTTYDPRLQKAKILPFITYPFQDEAIPRIVAAIDEGHDLVIEKSRDMGATFMVLGVMLWKFLFYDDVSFLLGSNKQETVDKTGNHKALFQKLDAMLRRLPLFLRWPVDVDDKACRTLNHLGNSATGSSFDGEATVSNFGRGDRRTAVMLDEFAQWDDGFNALKATADVSPCRLINSTHQGSHTAFYDYAQRCEHVMRLYWYTHPVKAVGLYKDDTGKVRSPAYDAEAKRRTAREMAEEWDIDVSGAAGRYFDVTKIEQLMAQAWPPYHRGELDWNENSHRIRQFRSRFDGRYRFWTSLGVPELVPTLPAVGKYVLGVDVSMGMGASNSVVSVWDRLLLQRVADFVDTGTDQAALADIIVVLSRFFNDAIAIIDIQGIGRSCEKRLREIGFGNLWYAPKSYNSAFPKLSDRAGFVMTPSNRLMILSEYARALYTGDAVNPCKEALKETLEFIATATGAEHSKALRRSMNPAGEGQFHGDMVIADALAWHVLKDDARVPEREREEKMAEPQGMGTFAGRRKSYLASLEKEGVF
jgi:hypothetical protein